MVQRVDVWSKLLVCVCLFLCGVQVASAQGFPADVHANCGNKQHAGCKEYELKGAYIYHFFKYIEWENEQDAERFVISILGKSPIEEVLNRLEKEKVIRNKTFDVYRFDNIKAFQKQFASAETQCHLLFVSKQAQEELEQHQFIATLAKKNIILLGESNDFLNLGGDINFIIDRNRLKFQINQKTLNKSSGLRVSAKLLKLAVLGNNYTSSDEKNVYSSNKTDGLDF